jgi:hypothetical protein
LAVMPEAHPTSIHSRRDQARCTREVREWAPDARAGWGQWPEWVGDGPDGADGGPMVAVRVPVAAGWEFGGSEGWG